MRTVQFNVQDFPLDYDIAKSYVDLTVSHLSKESMIVAWCDGQKNTEHPSVPECQHKTRLVSLRRWTWWKP